MDRLEIIRAIGYLKGCDGMLGWSKGEEITDEHIDRVSDCFKTARDMLEKAMQDN